ATCWGRRFTRATVVLRLFRSSAGTGCTGHCPLPASSPDQDSACSRARKLSRLLMAPSLGSDCVHEALQPVAIDPDATLPRIADQLPLAKPIQQPGCDFAPDADESREVRLLDVVGDACASRRGF